MRPLYVFLDTNIFLHYQPFDQIKWTELLNVPSVVLVATPIVVRELDEHKDQHKVSAIRARAQAALEKIESIDSDENDTSLPDRVKLEYATEPAVDFQQFGLRAETNDDHLIANCLTYLESEANIDLILISSDTGLRLKGKQQRMKVGSLPDKYRLPNAIDAVEKENRQLQRRIQQLENRFPKLELAFAGGANHIKATMLDPLEFSEERIQQKIAAIKNRYIKHQVTPDSKQERQNAPLSKFIQPYSLAGSFNSKHPESKEIKRYNDELAKFYEDYEEYLRRYDLYRNLQRRMMRLDIYLFNRGTAPAEDIDIFLHFPDGFRLYDEDNRTQMPEAPKPPSPPQTWAEMLHSPLQMRDFSSLTRTPHYLPAQSNVSAPDIKRSNSYDVTYSVQRLKQHMNESLDPLYVVFDSFESAASFRIDYRINAADLPDETTGVLHTAITRASDNR